jgi:DNA-binding MarR family transcriptional regulator
VRLQLTAQAGALHLAAQRQARRSAAAAVADLSEAERAELVSLLQRVRARLEAAD